MNSTISPPSDEGGGFLRSKKTEGEKNKTTLTQSLPQSRIRSTAPSSEGTIILFSFTLNRVDL